MFTRATGYLIIPAWLVAMGWVVAHDIVPTWTAQEPPRVRPSQWLRMEGSETQFSLELDKQPIGTIWSQYTFGDESIQRRDTLWIEHLPLLETPIRVTVDSVFTAEGLLDEFTVRLDSRLVEANFRLHGERFHSDFSFLFERGTHESSFKLPLLDGGVLGNSFNPFSGLPNLHVGQTWRMQVFNPVSALTGIGPRFLSVLVEVTGESSIVTTEGLRDCFVVEASPARRVRSGSASVKAWVDANGTVQRQEVLIPGLGTLRISRQARFDERALRKCRRFRLSSSADR